MDDELKIVLGAMLVVSIMVVSALYFAKNVERKSCYSFGAQSGREVKFAKYTLVSWDCLAKTSDGKWISTSMLREETNN